MPVPPPPSLAAGNWPWFWQLATLHSQSIMVVLLFSRCLFRVQTKPEHLEQEKNAPTPPYLIPPNPVFHPLTPFFHPTAAVFHTNKNTSPSTCSRRKEKRVTGHVFQTRKTTTPNTIFPFGTTARPEDSNDTSGFRKNKKRKLSEAAQSHNMARARIFEYISIREYHTKLTENLDNPTK